MNLTKDDIIKSVPMVAGYYGIRDVLYIENKARQALASKVADEHIAIMIKASCTSDKRKSYEMLMDYLDKQIATLQKKDTHQTNTQTTKEVSSSELDTPPVVIEKTGTFRAKEETNNGK